MTRFAQSEPTANRRQIQFKLVDATDNHTPEPGLNLVTLLAAMLVLKNGVDVGAAGTVDEIDGGFYIYTFTVGELDTLGVLQLLIDTVGAATAIEVLDFEVREVALVYGHLYPDDAVYLKVAGAAGAVPGINGVPTNPCGNLSDALELLDLLSLAKLKISPTGTSAFTLNDDMSGLLLEGTAGFPVVTAVAPAGDFTGCSIRQCAIEGLFGDITGAGLGGLLFENCVTNDDLVFEGVVQAQGCIFMHTIYQGAAKFGQLLFARDCEFLDFMAPNDPSRIDFQGNNAFVFLLGARGKVALLNNTSVGGLEHLIMLKNGSQLVIDATSIGDSLYHVSGQGGIVDNTPGGANIDRITLMDQIGVVGYEAAVSGTGTTTTVPIVSSMAAGAFIGMQIRVTDATGPTTVTREITAHTKPIAGQDDTVLTVDVDLGFIPVVGDAIVIPVLRADDARDALLDDATRFSGADVALTRKLGENRLELDFTAQTMILYDDDGVTPLRSWPLKTNAGPPEVVSTGAGVQTKRKPSTI